MNVYEWLKILVDQTNRPIKSFEWSRSLEEPVHLPFTAHTFRSVSFHNAVKQLLLLPVPA